MNKTMKESVSKGLKTIGLNIKPKEVTDRHLLLLSIQYTEGRELPVAWREYIEEETRKLRWIVLLEVLDYQQEDLSEYTAKELAEIYELNRAA